MPTVIVKQVECLRCKYQWIPRKPGRPATCPHCNNARWDEKRKE